jgi:hypothetical protein
MSRFDQLKGHVFAPVTATVEAGRLRFFNKAIGETNPAVTGPDSSGRVPVPPTYLFCLEMLDAENPFAFVDELGVPITGILHGEQAFAYHAPVRVGDVLRFEGRLADVFHKKGGELTFLVQQVSVTNNDGVQVAEIMRTIVLRKEALAA